MAIRYPAFSKASLWDYVFHRNKNGFHRCTSKIGNKRVIDDDEFRAWIIEQGKKYDKPVDISTDGGSKLEVNLKDGGQE